jgi:hypothetical protein
MAAARRHDPRLIRPGCRKSGVVDRITTICSAVEKADLIILALLVDQACYTRKDYS